jgi:hypothetical protein
MKKLPGFCGSYSYTTAVTTILTLPYPETNKPSPCPCSCVLISEGLDSEILLHERLHSVLQIMHEILPVRQNFGSRSSVAGIASWLRAAGFGVRMPVVRSDFPLLENVHTSYGSHPTSSSMGTGGKAAGTRS